VYMVCCLHSAAIAFSIIEEAEIIGINNFHCEIICILVLFTALSCLRMDLGLSPWGL
jgi:hypothetical protein